MKHVTASAGEDYWFSLPYCALKLNSNIKRWTNSVFIYLVYWKKAFKHCNTIFFKYNMLDISEAKVQKNISSHVGYLRSYISMNTLHLRQSTYLRPKIIQSAKIQFVIKSIWKNLGVSHSKFLIDHMYNFLFCILLICC